jgi:hypothetical protein
MATERVSVRIDKKTENASFDVNGIIGEGCTVIEQIEEMIGQRTKHEDKDERFQYRLQNPQPVGQL